ncbi:MAG: hypothetical protein U9R05_09345, partial [Chloroflexota bacterium]|nr:hypothetical protein [Chloroflexota bacterium]
LRTVLFKSPPARYFGRFLRLFTRFLDYFPHPDTNFTRISRLLYHRAWLVRVLGLILSTLRYFGSPSPFRYRK